MSEKPLPCPFCGQHPITERSVNGRVKIECDTVRCIGASTSWRDDEESALTRWNTRARPQAAADSGERGKKVLRDLKSLRIANEELRRWRSAVPTDGDTTRHTPESLRSYVFSLLVGLVDASAEFEKIASLWRGNGSCGFAEAEAYRLATGAKARVDIVRAGDYSQSNPAELRALLAKALDALTYGHAVTHSEWDRACLLSGRYCEPYLSSENAWVSEDSRPQAAPLTEWFVCPECGPKVKADEDGCCATCGADCSIEAAAPTEAATGEADTFDENARIHEHGKVTRVYLPSDKVAEMCAAARAEGDAAGYERGRAEGLREAAEVADEFETMFDIEYLRTVTQIELTGEMCRRIAAAILAKLKGDPQ
jgi:hypothetical protein